MGDDDSGHHGFVRVRSSVHGADVSLTALPAWSAEPPAFETLP